VIALCVIDVTYLLLYGVVEPGRKACEEVERCTGTFDVLARSVQYGIFGFTFDDFTYFCT